MVIVDKKCILLDKKVLMVGITSAAGLIGKGFQSVMEPEVSAGSEFTSGVS